MAVSKSKLSKSAWVLIALVIVLIIALPILHLTGFIDLSFLAVGFQTVMMQAAENTILGVLLLAGVFVLGAATFYAAKKYFIGNKAVVLGNTYAPQEKISAPSQQETVVSA